MTRLLITGQSVGNGYKSGNGGPWFVDPLVKFWNNRANREDLSLMGSGFIVPARGADPFDTVNDDNSPALHIANGLVNLRAGNAVRGVIAARNSAALSRWIIGGVAQSMLIRTNALWDLTGYGPASDWVDVHGPANEDDFATYKQDWIDRYNLMLAAGTIGSNTFITLCEHKNCPNVNSVLHQISAVVPNCRVAKTATIPTIDGTHPTAGGCALWAGAVLQTYLE